MKYEEIKINQTYETQKIITGQMVETFAEITGDKNPLHLDEEFASKTIFKKRIAHGILSLGIISSVLGMEFPGPGTIYMKQETKFLKPIYIDEKITIKITVKEKIPDKSRLILVTQIIKEDGSLGIDGEALVMFKN
ncbi:enoyl-CoA hydratase [Petrotoga sp. 9PW.55.5.1]|jgi:3-hydroxybutyryl-CoA dehydratase|uniref:MaoC family dehydratase n=1 Tax=Petrotoga sp. 9PW.55.5.1 TaxID=1308979 RepID=UPI000DC52BF8|nr:MaoC family dehydratase [Petrotoga sp. 9PW.55.5.1]RAO99156.1 enoyl-CoA hydratase [Petrotoga sp. 9PW.55.5.1]